MRQRQTRIALIIWLLVALIWFFGAWTVRAEEDQARPWGGVIEIELVAEGEEWDHHVQRLGMTGYEDQKIRLIGETGWSGIIVELILQSLWGNGGRTEPGITPSPKLH